MPRKVGSVLLLVGDRHFQADRHLLAAQSTYFRILFRSGTKRDRYGAIIVPGNPETFSLVLDYLTGDHELSIDELESILFDGSTIYRIQSLIYLSEFRKYYELREQHRIKEVKLTMEKMAKLKVEVSKLEDYIDNLQRRP